MFFIIENDRHSLQLNRCCNRCLLEWILVQPGLGAVLLHPSGDRGRHPLWLLQHNGQDQELARVSSIYSHCLRAGIGRFNEAGLHE